jgi:hypothetical protein
MTAATAATAAAATTTNNNNNAVTFISSFKMESTPLAVKYIFELLLCVPFPRPCYRC